MFAARRSFLRTALLLLLLAPLAWLPGCNDPGSFYPTPAPAIASVAPTTIIAGSPAFTLTVNGSGFVTSSAVQWNGSPRTTTYTSPTQLTAAITAAT